MVRVASGIDPARSRFRLCKLEKPSPFLPAGTTIFLILVLCGLFGRPFADVGQGWSAWETLQMVGLVLGVSFVANLLWWPFRSRHRMTPEERREIVGTGWPVVIWSLLVWAPLGEEFVFRYVLVGALYDVSPTLAFGMSGVLFGLVHSRGPLPKIVMGALLAWLYVGSGTLWAPIAVHFVWNGLVVLASRDDIDRAIRQARGY